MDVPTQQAYMMGIIDLSDVPATAAREAGGDLMPDRLDRSLRTSRSRSAAVQAVHSAGGVVPDRAGEWSTITNTAAQRADRLRRGHTTVGDWRYCG